MKFWVFLLFPFFGISQVIPPKVNLAIQAAHKQHNPLVIADQFYGLPYASHALSKGNPETFVIDFSGFDCVTFVENVWSLYRSNGIDSTFLRELELIRYARKPISFENRNHYLSAMFAQMEDKGLFKQVIPPAYRVLAVKKVDFLSQFLAPKKWLVVLPAIQQMEEDLAPMTYIPSAKFSTIVTYLQNGDIIAFVSKRKDLDYQHVGFVREFKGEFHLVHASQDRKQVCQSVESISVYLKNHPSMIGFNVFRPEYAN